MRYRKHRIWFVTVAFQVLFIAAALAIPGDVTGNGSVGFDDLVQIADWWTSGDCDLSEAANCDGADMTDPAGVPDGVVDFYDFALLSGHWLEGMGIPGDATGDGSVGLDDLIRIADWWTIDVCGLFNNCKGADMTGPNGVPDGVVDLQDFALMAAHWLESA